MAPDLESQLPSILNGVTLHKESVDGTQFLGQDASSQSLDAFLATAGKTPADFNAATAIDPAGDLAVVFFAFQIAGVDPGDLFDAMVAAGEAQNPTGSVTTMIVSGKQVAVGASSSTNNSTYIYLHAAVVYGVQAADPNLAAQALAVLPPVTAPSLPSAAPTTVPTSGPSASEAAFPNTVEQTLLTHVPSAIRSSCTRVHVVYPDELDSVRCTPSGQPNIDYTLFADADTMNLAYQDDMNFFGDPTNNADGCSSGNYENSYTISGTEAGRWACVVDKTNGRVIEWTDDATLILSYAASTTATWNGMISFWKNEAGPAH